MGTKGHQNVNKIVSKTVVVRGTEVPVESLKDNSNIYVIVECKHGQRRTKWSRRNNLCRECCLEQKVYNTSPIGRVITWGDKISKAKKGIKFSEKHKEALINKRKEKLCNRLKIDPKDFKGFPTSGAQFKLRCFVMNAINKKIIKLTVDEQDSVILKKIGYSIDELKSHLESKFQPGMSWDNYGEWHIDHVVPDSWFTYSSTDEKGFKDSYAINNLQPLWADQNIEKSNHYSGQYRPKRFYMLAGQFGSGKTTVANKLKDKFTVIEIDRINRKTLDRIISNNYFNEKPLLLDIPTLISSTYRRYSDKYEIIPIFILESVSVIEERLKLRGGTSSIESIKKRFSRMNSLSKEIGVFSGTADEVYEYLAHLKV
jgi:hypothetical protein